MVDETQAPAGGDPAVLPEVSYSKLFAKVTEREKDLKDKWIDKAERAWKIYSGDSSDDTPFNILYSNTEIIVPAVFSQKPIPDVRRRFDRQKADQPAAAMQKMLEFCLDTNLPSFPNFMTVVEDAVLDAALPGQGMIRVRLVNELATLDYVSYKKFTWGFCERWEDLSWIAFRYDMLPEDVIRTFPALSEDDKKTIRTKGSGEDFDKDSSTGEKKPATIAVYEHWDKATKCMTVISDCLSSHLLEKREDPLGLENFFPIPRKPLNFVHCTTDTLPRPLYRLYLQQAEELNEITRRIHRVSRAIKIRGMYAGQLPELAKIFEGQENTLIPSESPSQVLNMDKGLEAYIWLIPVERFITVLQTLFTIRDQIKGTIYEILGIGDILRGVSKASETLGAQELKDKWGSLRINKTRERTSEFIREGLRLLAEVSAKHTPPELWAKITGMEFKLPVEAESLAQSGQPPPPGETWQTVLQVLQDDLSRAYTVDVELNSTVDAEATSEKGEMSQFMEAIGSAMQAMTPLATMGPEGFETMKVILAAIVGKFRLAPDIVQRIEALPVPKGMQGPPPEIQQMKEDLDKQKEEQDAREQGFAKDEQMINEQMLQIKTLSDSLKNQQEAVKSDRQEFLRDQSAGLKEIETAMREVQLARKENEMLTRDGILKVREAKLATRPPAGQKP